MQRLPSSDCPTSCFHCELGHPLCDICSKKDFHCMKFHITMNPGLSACAWRSTASQQQVKTALALANDQLRTYYSDMHDVKQRNIRLSKGKNKHRHVRGLTRRLTITPDFFRNP